MWKIKVFAWKISVRSIICLWEILNREQSNWIWDMSARGLLIENLLHRYNVEQPEVIADFWFTFITCRL